MVLCVSVSIRLCVHVCVALLLAASLSLLIAFLCSSVNVSFILMHHCSLLSGSFKQLLEPESKNVVLLKLNMKTSSLYHGSGNAQDPRVCYRFIPQKHPTEKCKTTVFPPDATEIHLVIPGDTRSAGCRV